MCAVARSGGAGHRWQGGGSRRDHGLHRQNCVHGVHEAGLLPLTAQLPWLPEICLHVCGVMSVTETCLRVCGVMSVTETCLHVCGVMSVTETFLHVCGVMSVTETCLHVCGVMSVTETFLHVCGVMSMTLTRSCTRPTVPRSVNNAICHAIPDGRPLQNGDIVNLDITVFKASTGEGRGRPLTCQAHFIRHFCLSGGRALRPERNLLRGRVRARRPFRRPRSFIR